MVPTTWISTSHIVNKQRPAVSWALALRTEVWLRCSAFCLPRCRVALRARTPGIFQPQELGLLL